MPESPGSNQGIAMKSRRPNLPLAAALSLVLATPALAHPVSPPSPPPGAVDAAGNVYGDTRPEWRGGPAAVPQPGYDAPGYEQARADWLNECRRHHGNGKTVGGVIVGGLVGGVIGNRFAGPGNRTTGTVVGAVAGAAVGGAIGSAADNRDARDYCEAYLDQHMGQQGRGGYVYGYQPMMMVPVMMVTVAGPVQQQGECKETIVTEEWVVQSDRSSRRYIVRQPRPRHDKRVRITPDKRVRL